jgi:hypothetical protein
VSVPACRICYPYEPSCNGNVAIGCGSFAAGFGIIGSGAIDRHLRVEPSPASSLHRSVPQRSRAQNGLTLARKLRQQHDEIDRIEGPKGEAKHRAEIL